MIAGNFAVFPFLSVLQMLMSSGRTGVLEVQGERGGRLWLKEGDIVHALSGRLEGEAAMQMLTSLDAGEFEFVGSDLRPKETLAMSGDLALRQLFQEAEAWKPLLAAFPDWSHTPVFTEQWNENRLVTRGQFQVLSGVERGLSVADLLEQTALPPRLVLGALGQFQQAGLLRLEDPFS